MIHDSAATSNEPRQPEDDEPKMRLGQRFRQPQTLLSFSFAIMIAVFLVLRLDIDPAEVGRQIRSANPGLFALGLLVFYSGFMIRVLRWRRMLGIAGVTSLDGVQLPPIRELLEIILLSWFANCVVPAKLGDAYRGFLLKRRAGAPFTTTMGAIAAERLIDLLVLIGLLLPSGLIVFGRNVPSGAQNVLVYGSVTVIAAAIIVGVAWLFRSWILARLPDRLSGYVGSAQTGLFENLKNPWRSIGQSIAIWSLEGVRFFFVAWSLGTVLPGSTALALALLSSLATVSPLTPAGLGIVEVLLISLLPLVGVPENTAAAVVVLDRVISYFSLIIVGLPLYILSVRRDVATTVQQSTSA